MDSQALYTLKKEIHITTHMFPEQSSLITENTILLKSLVSEIQELRHYNESLNNQLYKFQSEFSQKERKNQNLIATNNLLQTENRKLNKEISRSVVSGLLAEIMENSFLNAIDHELSSSIKIRSNGTSSFLDSFPKNSKLSIEAFKKNLMNSTKKKQKIVVSPNFRGINNANNFESEKDFEDNSKNGYILKCEFIEAGEKLTVCEKSLFGVKISNDSGVHSRKSESIDFGGLNFQMKESLKNPLKNMSHNFESEFAKKPYEIFSEKQFDSLNSHYPKLGCQISANDFNFSKNQSKPIQKKQSNEKISKNAQKPYSESEKIGKEYLSIIQENGLEAPDLSSSNKELTLKDMMFQTDPKTPETRLNLQIRIKDEVSIENFDKFNKLKNHFSVIYMNKFNNQNNILNNSKKEFEKKQHVFFVCFGAKKTGKTYSIQGYKDFPGVMPSFVGSLDFSSPVTLQMFDVKNEIVEDLIKENSVKIEERIFVNKYTQMSSVSVSSLFSLNRIFKVVISRRMKKEKLEDWNFVIRLIFSSEKSVSFVDCCVNCPLNFENLSFLRIVAKKEPKKIMGSKNAMLRFLLPANEIDAKFCFHLIGHLSSVESAVETSMLISLLE